VTGYSQVDKTRSILKGGSIIIKDSTGTTRHTATFSSSQDVSYTIANSNPTLLSIGADGGFLTI